MRARGNKRCATITHLDTHMYTHSYALVHALLRLLVRSVPRSGNCVLCCWMRLAVNASRDSVVYGTHSVCMCVLCGGAQHTVSFALSRMHTRAGYSCVHVSIVFDNLKVKYLYT